MTLLGALVLYLIYAIPVGILLIGLCRAAARDTQGN